MTVWAMREIESSIRLTATVPLHSPLRRGVTLAPPACICVHRHTTTTSAAAKAARTTRHLHHATPALRNKRLEQCTEHA